MVFADEVRCTFRVVAAQMHENVLSYKPGKHTDFIYVDESSRGVI